MHDFQFTFSLFRRRTFLVRSVPAIVASALTALTFSAHAVEWPSAGPIKVIVPYTAGGPTDTITRTIMQKLSQRLNQTVLIENRPGANGMIGIKAAASANPDGYSFLSVVAAYAINPVIYKSASYKSTDMIPVSQFADIPLFLYVPNDLPVNTVAELMQYAKSNGRGVTYASSGAGSGAHLSGAYLASQSGAPMMHVPYKGASAFVTDLLSGRVDMAFDTSLLEMPYVKAGKLKALAVATAKRWPAEPDIPTMEEAGFPGFTLSSWAGFLAPSGTPSAIVNRMSAEIDDILKMPDIQASFKAAAFLPVGGTPEQFKALIEREAKKYEEVIRVTGVTLD